jgi:formyltetrahydrofolate deformylase
MANAILRVRCPDCTGIIAALSDFVFRHGGNILDLDQHSESESGVFFMRQVWSLDRFNLDEDGIQLGLEVFAR